MSFGSILAGVKKGLGTALGVEHVLAPFLGFVPGVGPAITIFDHAASRFLSTIGTLEASDPRDGQGGLKAEALIADFEASLAFLKEIAAAKGQQVTFDDKLLRDATADVVSGLNKFARVKASVQMGPIPK